MAAEVWENVEGKQVLNEFTGWGNAVSRLHTIWVDGGLMVDTLCSRSQFAVGLSRSH